MIITRKERTEDDMDAKFSPRVREVITFSREEALRLEHKYIGVEHLLLGLIKEGEGTVHYNLAFLMARVLAKSHEPSSSVANML